MSSCKDKKNNIKAEAEESSMGTVDRYYHNTESFLYRYRWWVVLVLAILLAYYLYTKNESSVDTAVGTPSAPGLIGQNELNVGAPVELGVPTEQRKLFNL